MPVWQTQEQIEERAILVGVNLGKDVDFIYSMRELAELARACQVEVVGEVVQKLDSIHASHYIGKGKVKEIANLLLQVDGNIVIFNDELTPSQIRNLEAELQCTVIDRTILILDIFASRAQTKEAQLQVEVARLQYMLPRLVGLRASLSRQGAGVGVANRGLGETKLELDRRKLEERIHALNKELETLVAQRQLQRKQRKKNEIPVVSLVGYTNAGKSTLMNAIMSKFQSEVNKQAVEKDMLFATLETSVRHVSLPDNKAFLLTDTVGFVDKLPHHLVRAFRSTLEEVTESDVLIHVVDYSNDNYLQQIEVTMNTLKEIGVKDIPMIFAYNKADLHQMSIPHVEGDRVYMSAKEKVGIEELVEQIRNILFQDYVQCEMIVPYDQGAVVSYFNDHAYILGTTYEPDGTRLKLECRKADYEKYKSFIC